MYFGCECEAQLGRVEALEREGAKLREYYQSQGLAKGAGEQQHRRRMELVEALEAQERAEVEPAATLWS